MDPFARIIRGLPSSWDQSMATSIRPCVIQAALWSPCSRFIAISWDGETTIEILDPITLERVYMAVKVHIKEIASHGQEVARTHLSLVTRTP